MKKLNLQKNKKKELYHININIAWINNKNNKNNQNF